MNQATREARCAFIITDRYDFRNDDLGELRLDAQALTGIITSRNRKLLVAQNEPGVESAAAKADREKTAKALKAEISTFQDMQARIDRKIEVLETEKNKARTPDAQRGRVEGSVPLSTGRTSSIPPRKRVRYDGQQETIDIESETGTPLATGDMTMDRFLRLMAAQINSSDDLKLLVRDLSQSLRGWNDVTHATWIQGTEESRKQQEMTREEFRAFGGLMVDAIEKLTHSTNRLGTIIAERLPLPTKSADKYFPEEEMRGPSPAASGVPPDTSDEVLPPPVPSFTSMGSQSPLRQPDHEPIVPDDHGIAAEGEVAGGEPTSGDGAAKDASE